jgi:uncharacterized membrane protein YtjA (UPF0391 family)
MGDANMRFYGKDRQIPLTSTHNAISATGRSTANRNLGYSLSRMVGTEVRALAWDLRVLELRPQQGGYMLYWALMFLVVAIVAGIFGFAGIAATAAGIAKLLFVIFLVLFAIAMISHLGRRGSSGV